MNLRKILSDDEIVELARLAETGAGQVLLKVIQEEVLRIRDDIEANPMVSEGKSDFRYKAGMLAGLKLAGSATGDARLIVEKSERKG